MNEYDRDELIAIFMKCTVSISTEPVPTWDSVDGVYRASYYARDTWEIFEHHVRVGVIHLGV